MDEIFSISSLMVRMSEGDSSAYDLLFRRYYAPMVLYADNLLHDREESEDLVIDLFTSLWQKRATLSDIKSDKSFLFILLRNKVIDTLRIKSRFRHEELTDSFFEESEEDTVSEIELYARLKAEIDKLPLKCAEVLRLKLDGLTDHEISEQINIQYETVRSHVKRGISLLRKKFDKSMLLFFLG